MAEYGKGMVAGAAAVLPATSALALMITNNIQPWLLFGFVFINVIWLVVISANISRFLINRSV